MAPSAQRSTGQQVVVEVIAVVVALAVALGLSAAFIGLSVNDAQASAKRAVSSAEAGDIGALVSSIEGLRSDVQALSNYTKSPAWWFTKYVPAVGEPVRAASTLTNAANEVSQAADGFLAMARSLDQAQAATDGQLVPTQVLTEMGPAGEELAVALSAFATDLESINVNAAYGPAQGVATRALQEAKDLLPQVTLLARTLPSLAVLMGANGPQKWFVALQNGGESRGTGGLLGSFAIVEFDQGKAKPGIIGPNGLLTAKATTTQLPEDTKALWNAARMAEVYGVNLSPNYPYAGELISSLWGNQTGSVPDAVLALDQRATVMLIEAVGGITVDGVTLTGENALAYLTVGVYERFPNDSSAKDAFVTEAMGQLVKKLAAGAASPTKLARELMTAVLDRSMFLWAKAAQVQQPLGPSPLGGEVPDAPGPFAMAVVNNNAGNKMDTFLHTTVTLTGGECVAAGRRSTLTVELFNDPPPGKLPDSAFGRTDRRDLKGLPGTSDGSNSVRLAMYVPSGAYVSGTTPEKLYSGEERNHPVSMFGVELKRGERKTITVEFTQFGSVEELNSYPSVQPQPMLNPQKTSVVQGPKCG